MKNLSNDYTKEMSVKDMEEVTGGGTAGPAASYYTSSGQAGKTGKLLYRCAVDACDYVSGLFNGFFD
jgi:hypothetical protein